MKNNVFNSIISILLFSLPLVYGLYLIYIRVLVSRAPRDIGLIESKITFFILGSIIIGLSIRLYLSLKTLEIIPTKEPKNKIIIWCKRWLFWLNSYIELIKTHFLRTLAKNFKSYGTLSLELIRKTYYYVDSKRFEILLFITEIGVKILLVLLFMVEVFYCKQINYFYKLLWLLLIPLVIDILIYMMNLFYKDNIKALIGFLDSKPMDNEYDEFCFHEDAVILDVFEDIYDLVDNHLDPVFDHVYTLANIHDIRKRYKFKVILLLITICYLCTWLYVFFVGFGLL